MKKLILLIIVLLMPLALASQTQHRFKVLVGVFGDDDDAHIINTLESNLKRELRLLGDVDIVDKDENWRYFLYVYYLRHEFKDGTKTGWVSLAKVFYERIPDFYFKADLLANLKRPPVYVHFPVAAHWDIDNLDKYCVNTVGSIDKSVLAPIRKLLR